MSSRNISDYDQRWKLLCCFIFLSGFFQKLNIQKFKTTYWHFWSSPCWIKVYLVWKV